MRSILALISIALMMTECTREVREAGGSSLPSGRAPRLTSGASGVDSLPRYRVKRVRSSPPLTARIDQPPWPSVEEVGPMRVIGTPGTVARDRTIVKACWNEAGLRIIWHCEDPRVIAQYRGRDDPIYAEDVVEIFASPSGDLKHYFEINFNPLGAAFDAKIHNPTIRRAEGFTVDADWNCPGLRWVTAGEGRFNRTAGKDKWWAVEAVIPFASLGADVPKAGDTWRAVANRIEYVEPMQICSWSAMPDPSSGLHQADRFGLWTFEE